MKKYIVIVFTALFVLAVINVVAFAGNLDPSSPPDSTMYTLEEIHDKLITIENEIANLGQGIKQVIRDTFELSSSTGDDSFSPYVDPTKCIVYLRVMQNSGSLEPRAAIVTDLTDHRIYFRKCSSTTTVTIEYQIVEYK